MTRSALAVALVVLGSAVSGCGGEGSSAPTDAPVEEFCEAHTASFGFDSAHPAEAAGVVKRHGERIAALGTPERIPDEARAGFEIVVESLRDGHYPAQDAGAYEPNVEEFYAYVAETCGGVDDLGLPEVPALPAE